jgi:hypothetical protein
MGDAVLVFHSLFFAFFAAVASFWRAISCLRFHG